MSLQSGQHTNHPLTIAMYLRQLDADERAVAEAAADFRRAERWLAAIQEERQYLKLAAAARAAFEAER